MRDGTETSPGRRNNREIRCPICGASAGEPCVMPSGEEVEFGKVHDARRAERCSGPTCEARIIWALTEAGKRQPFDAQPDPKGNRTLENRGERYRGEALPTAVPAPKGETLFGAPVLYMPHHATCKNTNDFRKGRGGRQTR